MQIEEAFTTQAIEDADTNVTDEEEVVVREMIARLHASDELDDADIGVLMFVAGRTHQAANTRIPIWASPTLLNQFLEFLASPKE
jgi:hypothetical protein